MKCVSEMSAISILLFWSVARISFLWFASPFEFQVRVRRDLDVGLLGIINIYEI